MELEFKTSVSQTCVILETFLTFTDLNYIFKDHTLFKIRKIIVIIIHTEHPNLLSGGVNTMTKRSLGDERIHLAYRLHTACHWWTPRQELKAGTWRQELSQTPERTSVDCHVSCSHLATFIIQPRFAYLGMVLPTVDWTASPPPSNQQKENDSTKSRLVNGWILSRLLTGVHRSFWQAHDWVTISRSCVPGVPLPHLLETSLKSLLLLQRWLPM